MAVSKLTQAFAICEYTSTHGSITSKEANDHLGITRLAAVIHDMEHHGYTIGRAWETVPSRYGATRVKRYTVTKPDKKCQGKTEQNNAE